MATFNVISSSNVISGSGTGGSSYLVYTALVSQSGTNPPYIPLNADNDPGGSPLANTIGDIVFGYDGTGGYSLTGPVGCFPLTKTVIVQPVSWGKDVKFTMGSNEETDENVLFLTSSSLAAGAYSTADDLLYFTPIIIYVYP